MENSHVRTHVSKVQPVGTTSNEALPHKVCLHAQLSGFANHLSGSTCASTWKERNRLQHALNGNSAVGEPCFLVLFGTHLFLEEIL